jgi:hypothetical protein
VLSIGGPPELVVVVDGIFLQRPELADLWDATVWVEADPDEAAGRGLKRDALGIDSLDAERERYRLRYLRAQRRYIEEQRPQERATFFLRNTSLETNRSSSGCRDRDEVAQRAEPGERLTLELADPLPRQVELVPDRLERPRLALEAEAQLEDPPLTLR